MLEYMYEKLIGQGKNFEIIDMDFSGDVPWLCMPQKSWEVPTPTPSTLMRLSPSLLPSPHP